MGSIDAQVRNAAEQRLAEMQTLPGTSRSPLTCVPVCLCAHSLTHLFSGYCSTLAQILASEQLDPDMRQLAGLVLRLFVQQHWSGDGHVAVSDDERAAVRSVVPHVLGEARSKLRTTAGLVIAAMFKYDWPTRWPTLLSDLVRVSYAPPPRTRAALPHTCLALMLYTKCPSQ